MQYRVEIELRGGVRARLVQLEQSGFYEGLLEGVPTREMNARSIAALVRARACSKRSCSKRAVGRCGTLRRR